MVSSAAAIRAGSRLANQSILRPAIASGSGSARAEIDRYKAVHAFFSNQASSTSTSQLHTSNTRQLLAARSFSSAPSKPPCPNCPPVTQAKPLVPGPGPAQDYAPFVKRLLKSLPNHQPLHRPTKEQLLGAATGFWQRLRIRMKWFFIRGWRRFNTDDMSAFASWFVLGNTLWILIGTTTFFSAVFATLNSLSLQKSVARWISDYLTSNTGFTVIFESAIVPRWGASTITFRNVYVSRRPQDADAPPALLSPPSPKPFLPSTLPPDALHTSPSPDNEADNYTMFDVNLDEVEVTLSVMRWLDGKGLVKDAKVKGVRGVIDRRSVWWDHSVPVVPADFRHPTQVGDFELESLSVEDFLITVYQPGNQRPFNVSVFNATLGPFRKRWMFYDAMSAEGITGQFDNCLFSLHMPQRLSMTRGDDAERVKRMARFRIDGLPIEHAQYASGSTGPMSWITSGKLDAVLDIKFPRHPDDEVNLQAIFEEITRNVADITSNPMGHDSDSVSDAAAAQAAAVAAKRSKDKEVIPGQHRLQRPALRAPVATPQADDEAEEKRTVTIDIDLRFRDLKAAVPMFTSDLSVKNNAFIRPIVAFINANRTLVPIHCQVEADLNDFDGSWTLFETGLMSSVSDQIYQALAHHVSSEVANSRRIRQVGAWGIQKGAEVVMSTLKSVVDPVHVQSAAT